MISMTHMRLIACPSDFPLTLTLYGGVGIGVGGVGDGLLLGAA